MSAPARKLAVPRPLERGIPSDRRGAPAGRPARPTDRPVHTRSVPTTRRRRQHRLGFALFASALVGSMVLGIVVLHALLAQQSFRIAEAERRIDDLAAERLELVSAQATLSAPGRIAGWAVRHDMRLPDDIRILRAPEGSGDPTGADVTSDDAIGIASARDADRGSGPAEDG